MIPEYKKYRASPVLMFFHFLSVLLLLSQRVGGFHVGGSFTLRGGVGSFAVRHLSSDVNVSSRWTRQLGARTSRRVRLLTVNGAFQNEYQTFFNDASRLGEAFISSLSPEERAKRAYEGEQLEDDIIDIAILLRRKADAMVAETGGVNFEVIRPMIDEISALKSKYRVVVGAASQDESSGKDETPGEVWP